MTGIDLLERLSAAVERAREQRRATPLLPSADPEPPTVRALTVQQPWAHAIVHLGKLVENRTTAWAYRGPLLIHAGTRWSDRGARSRLVLDALYAQDVRWAGVTSWDATTEEVVLHQHALRVGVVIGVVDLVGVHTAEQGCCDSPWGEQAYAEHGGTTRRDVVHLELANPVALPDPVHCKGRLGLWRPDADTLEAVLAQVETR